MLNPRLEEATTDSANENYFANWDGLLDDEGNPFVDLEDLPEYDEIMMTLQESVYDDLQAAYEQP